MCKNRNSQKIIDFKYGDCIKNRNISYTKNQTIGIWLGNLDNSIINYTGGNQPTEIVRNYFQVVQDDSQFDKPNSIIEKRIDGIDLVENHKITLANGLTPERYTQTELFSNFNLPTDISNKFAQVEKIKVQGRVENGNAVIEFDAKDYETYIIKVGNKKIEEISGKNGKQTTIIPLSASKQTITIENFYSLSPDNKISQELSFVKRNKDTINDKWYI